MRVKRSSASEPRSLENNPLALHEKSFEPPVYLVHFCMYVVQNVEKRLEKHRKQVKTWKIAM